MQQRSSKSNYVWICENGRWCNLTERKGEMMVGLCANWVAWERARDGNEITFDRLGGRKGGHGKGSEFQPAVAGICYRCILACGALKGYTNCQ